MHQNGRESSGETDTFAGPKNIPEKEVKKHGHTFSDKYETKWEVSNWPLRYGRLVDYQEVKEQGENLKVLICLGYL